MRFLLADNEDTIGVRIGVRLEQNPVDQTEDRGVQADAKAQAQDRDRRESLAAPEVAESVANVLEEHSALYECTAETGSKQKTNGFTTKKRS